MLLKRCILYLTLFLFFYVSNVFSGDISENEKRYDLCTSEKAKEVFRLQLGPKLLEKLNIISVEPFYLSRQDNFVVCEVLYTLDQRGSKEDPLLVQISYYGKDFIINGFIVRITETGLEHATKSKFYINNLELIKKTVNELKGNKY